MKNAQLSHEYYGVPVQGIRPSANVPGSRLASGSAPYLGRGHYCAGLDDTCMAPKAKGTDFCIGHLRSKGEA